MNSQKKFIFTFYLLPINPELKTIPIYVYPTKNGRAHADIIFIFDKTAPFIPNTEIEKLWGHGFTKTKKVDKVNNLGVYFTAYLGDMELEEVKSNGIEYDTKDIREIKEIDGIVLDKPKYFVKGARLSLPLYDSNWIPIN